MNTRVKAASGTPGPWMYQEDGDGIYQIYSVDGVGNFAEAVGEADEEADASLMASAPTMERALKEIERLCGCPNPNLAHVKKVAAGALRNG